MRDFLLFGREPFVREGYLLHTLGLSADTIKYWKKIKLPCEKVQGETYWQYSAIPSRTSRKLPWRDTNELCDKAREEETSHQKLETEKQANRLQEQLQKARDLGFTAYRALYDSYGPEKARAYAKKHSVWAKIVQLNKAGKKPAQLFAAYNLLEPGAYETAASFSNALRRAARVESLVDFVRHGNEGNHHAKTSLLEHEYWVRLLVSMGKGYEAPYIFDKVNEVCAWAGIRPIGSVSWIKTYLRRPDVQFDTEGYRYGLMSARQHLPYLPLESALYANDQWQIDGWWVPFYHLVKVQNRAGKTVNSFQRLVLFVVRDAHSRKVLGYSFGESENTALILAALRQAVEKTGALPAEIVSDNHSFNQTKEASYLKDALSDRGTTWTVTMNPQHKSIVEGGFNQFDERFCKPIQGWVGGSPLNRKKSARPKLEVKEEQVKAANTRSKGEVIALVTRLLEQANDASINKRRPQSPNACYEASEQPNARAVVATDIMELFWKTTRCTVRRGGITLEKEGQRHYYQLPDAQTQKQWYKQEVIVRYDDDYEMVQLLNPATEALICVIERTQRAHGAIANQSGQDHSRFSKHGHLLKDLEQTRRADNQAMQAEVDERYGEVPYELLNPLTAPKDDMLSARAQYEVGQLLKTYGVQEATLVPVAKTDPLKGTVFSRTARQAAPVKPGPFDQQATLRLIPADEGYEEWEDEE